MGCGQSKIDQEEAVCRCRERKRLMADAVQARNAFAAAHSAYTVLLKSTGGALSDFAHGEAPDPSLVASHSHLAAAAAAAASVSAPPPPSTAAALLAANPPPLPFPDFSHGGLQRSSSTPNIPMPDPRAAAKNRPPAGAAIREEEEEEEDGHIRTDSDDDDDDDDEYDDHHEHDDVSVDEMVHGLPPKRGVMDSVGSSPVTPQPPPRPNPSSLTPPSATPPPPMPEPQLATWDYFFGPTPTPPPTLEQSTEETWIERREKESVPVVNEPVAPARAAEERPPQTTLEKADTIEELAANLPRSKPIIRKPLKAPGPPPEVHYQHAASIGAVETRKGKMVKVSGTASLLQIVSQLDDHFLKSSESAHDVSKKLEATRMHYHSNHADSRGKCGSLICFLILTFES